MILKWIIPGNFFFYFLLFNAVENWFTNILYKYSLISGIEPQIFVLEATALPTEPLPL